MDKKWPFGFFVYRDLKENEGADQVEPEAEVFEEDFEAETVSEPAVTAEDVVSVGTSEIVEEDVVEESADAEQGEQEAELEADAEEYDEEENLPDLEEELEIALEEAHKKEVAKTRLIKGITTGVAIVTAIGFATGFGIRAYLKRK